MSIWAMAQVRGSRNGAVGDRELRGVWVATVLNIDYPSRPTTDAATLQAEFRSQLYRLRQAGINALFVQVRPAGDAIYPSDYAPWSRWLTGRQGVAPASDFDPLKFMIEEAHGSGVELHAWVNPYRVAMSLDSFSLAAEHLFYRHRDWVLTYGERMYLDPGLPAVRAHLGLVIDELVEKYDIDGIHFDDYFYPYPRQGELFPDQETYRVYGKGWPIADWRRGNVNEFVAETHARIKAKKPWVRFGVSPFGVWRNLAEDPVAGSNTHANATSYDDLYADALGWARSGTVDYLAPQLYWNIGFEAADYRELLAWWAANVPSEVTLYVGQAAYKVGVSDQAPAWNDLEELPRQATLNRNYSNVRGSIFFSARSILENPFGLAERMADFYPELALLPEINGGRVPPATEVKVFKPKRTEQGNLLVWEVDKSLTREKLPHYFAVYRGSGSTQLTLLHRTPYGQGCHRLHYYDKTADPLVEYQYRVVPLNRFHRPPVQVAR